MANLNVDLASREFTALPVTILVSWVYEVIKVESPIHKNEVMKRICDALGIKRVGKNIREKFAISFKNLSNTSQRGDFLWLSEMSVPNKSSFLFASENIQKAVDKGQIGFK
jgi:hypothetical protein